MNGDISISTRSLSKADRELIKRAEEVTRTAFDPDQWGGAHLVGAALRTTDGKTFTGVSLPANVGRVSSCAEPIAIGAAIANGHDAFDTIVAVRHPLPGESRDHEVVPACGACRELIADHGDDTDVIVPRDDGLAKVRAIDLLPTRTW
ncbi:MAG: cytidine deaminase [Halobacteriaceae archaeon]